MQAEGKMLSLANYRTLRWLLIPVIAIHNFEEWLTFPSYGEVAGAMAARFGVSPEMPSWEAMQLALIIVTLVPALIVVWASVGRQHQWKDFAVCGLAGIFFANVFMPHIPAAIGAHGYSPGLITAVAINLPFCLLLWRSAIGQDILSARQVLIAAFVGAALLLPSLVGVLALSKAPMT